MGREVRVHKIAEINDLPEAPKSAIAGVDPRKPLLRVGFKEDLGDVQILDVVDLVPLLVFQDEGVHPWFGQLGDDLENLLIILVVPKGGAVGFKEGNIVGSQKLLAEPIDVHRLIVGIGIGEAELALVEKRLDSVLAIEGDDRSVHPRPPRSDQNGIRRRESRELLQDAVLDDQIRFKKKRILLEQVFFGQIEGVDVVGLVIDRVVDEYDGCVD